MDPCFSHNPQGFQFFQGLEQHDALTLSHGGEAVSTTAAMEHDHALTYHVAVLRDKVQQLEPMVGMVVSPFPHHLRHKAAAMTASSACSVLREISAAASAMAHRLELGAAAADASFSRGPAFGNEINAQMLAAATHQADTLPFDFHHEPAAVFAAGATTAAASHAAMDRTGSFGVSTAAATSGRTGSDGSGDVDVVELEASYLLARYTHYCAVCGKGFKRDANLRMHMRAHGDEHKTSAALRNPAPAGGGAGDVGGKKRRYSCPADGCRWNRRHPRFQALKSVVCAKNHYRRSHCPRMYACRRCGGKQFAVLSDLRTHEKHCGELRWRCSCGTFFSRKDKLMGHVALFAAGHTPVPVATAAAVAERS